MKFILIADYLADEVLGGSEINNEELAISLRNKGHSVLEWKCAYVTAERITDLWDSCFIVSNFTELLPEAVEALCQVRFIIYEHDHKYIRSRNPAVYKHLRAPNTETINIQFYRQAIAVLCQSKYHARIVRMNTGLNNIISVSGNMWSEKSLSIMKKCLEKDKVDQYSILNSNIHHKGTAQAIEYCVSNGHPYELVSSRNYEDFLEMLSRNDKFVFFPKTPETLSRVVCEARMMGMKVLTNNLVGATKEKWFKLKGEPLIDMMYHKREEITELVGDLFKNSVAEDVWLTSQDKLVSIVMPAYNDEKHVTEALEDLLSQTYSNIEIIIVDDGSTDDTASVCKRYADQYDLISFYKKENGGTGSALNYGFSKAVGDYATWVSSDDRRHSTSIEKLVNALEENDVELAFTAYHSQRFNRAWRSYTPSKTNPGYKWATNGFIHDTMPSKKTFIVDNWVDINLDCCHSGVSFIFTKELKDRSGDYLTVPGEDYHMEVKMGMLAKGGKVAYLDEVLGWHRFPEGSLTATNPACVLEAEKITKDMIKRWKETGEVDE